MITLRPLASCVALYTDPAQWWNEYLFLTAKVIHLIVFIALFFLTFEPECDFHDLTVHDSMVNIIPPTGFWAAFYVDFKGAIS